MKERVFTFGTDGILMGVLTEPDQTRPDAPVVVMSNVGLNPRVGPHRCWVELARVLATLGFASFRFDLNGLGDSLPRRDARNDLERACVDLGEALDFLKKKRGSSTFLLVGMCSGTDAVHQVATKDSRVAGAVFLDGYSYETLRSKIHKRLRRLTVAGIKRAIRRRLPRLGGHEVGEFEEIYQREYPTPRAMSADLETMLARNTKLLFIYSGGLWLFFNYREQFFEMLRPARFEERIEVELRATADHVYMLPAERRWMVQRVSSWIAGQFSA